jgi:hypothetical protein
MDIDSNPIGVDYRAHIDESLGRCEMLLAVIGSDWLGTGNVGTRRIDDPSDLVRLEVTSALARGIRVVPLLIDDTEMPSVEELPEDLKGLKFRQAFRVDSGVDFHHHLDRLCAAIEAAAPRAVAAAPPPLPLPPKPATPLPPKPATPLPPKPAPAPRQRDESRDKGIRSLESAASPGRQEARPPSSGLAITAVSCATAGPFLAYILILGSHLGIRMFVFSLFGLSGAAIICGHLARTEVNRKPSLSGNRLAVIGLIVGYILLLIAIVVTIALIHDSILSNDRIDSIPRD